MRQQHPETEQDRGRDKGEKREHSGLIINEGTRREISFRLKTGRHKEREKECVCVYVEKKQTKENPKRRLKLV